MWKKVVDDSEFSRKKMHESPRWDPKGWGSLSSIKLNRNLLVIHSFTTTERSDVNQREAKMFFIIFSTL